MGVVKFVLSEHGYPQIKRDMTTNKQFNSYKEGLDLEFLREYCMEHGERRVMERGETLEEAASRHSGWRSWSGAASSTWFTTTRREGLLHGLRLRGRVRGRLPLLPRRRRVGGEHRGRHALRGAHHQRTRAAGTVRQRPEDGEDGREDTQEPVQDGLWTRPRPLPLHRPQPLPSAHRPLSAGGADALAEGHRLVPQHHAHLPEQTPQGDYIRKDIKPNSLPIILLAQKTLN